MKDNILIGILALQGCVNPHKIHLEAAGVKYREIKSIKDIDNIDGYILPGGESGVMLKLINIFGLEEALKEEFAKKPVWGICAGCILMAKEVINPKQQSFNLIDITVTRNGYGSQLHSSETLYMNYPVVFIRAPIISKLGGNVEKCFIWNNNPVFVKQGKYMATTFHSELTAVVPSPLHVEFIKIVKKYKFTCFMKDRQE
jgi:5'-phosphate synthase pdxT subunit